MAIARLSPGEWVAPARVAATASATDAALQMFVALAAPGSTKGAELAAAVARKGTSALSAAYEQEIRKIWDDANTEALTFLNLVLKNNPTKSADQILKRPDVKQAMREPYEAAAEKSEALLRKAWAEAEADTVKKLKGEFKLFKQEWKGYDLDTELLDALVGDLHENAKAMRSRFAAAIGAEGRPIGKVATNGRMRASYTAQTAVWGVATTVRDAAYAKAGLNKIWISRNHPNRCTECKSLHGKIVGPGEQFPHGKMTVYRGKLYGPPRHPNCYCVAVLTTSKKN